MTLLTEVMERPLDPGYAAAAERKAAEPAGEGRRGPKVARDALVLLLAIAIGLGSVWAARALRSPSPGANARSVLIEQIQARAADGEALSAQNSELRDQIHELQEQALDDAAVAAVEQAQQLGISAGTTPVVGPGVVLTMEDSALAQAGQPDADDGRVQDYDLQIVVNDLWASGAEAIAINGVRLTTGTAIRTAGETVLVDLQPLVSPYTIEAIGDPDAMRTTFAASYGAAYLRALSGKHGISSELAVVDELSLPSGNPPPASLTTESDGG